MGPPGAEEASVELVHDRLDLDRIRDTWRGLAVDRENAFVTPDWFDSWLRHCGDECRALVAVVRDGPGGVAGILPLVTSSSRRSRLVRFPGSSMGDHFHPAAPAAADATVAAAAAEAVRRAGGRLPPILLENVDADATWWRAMAASAGGPKPLVARPQTLPRIDLSGRSYEEYLAARSRNLRSQLGRRRRALERDHAATFRWSRSDAEVATDVQTVLRLHGMRWAERAGSSPLTRERPQAFLTDFAERAHRHGWLRLCVLEADGAPVAAWLGWRLGGRYAYYQAGFDPRWSKQGVGLVLLAETIRAAAEEGAREYDMLLGDEAFKLRFADGSREVCTALIAPRLRPVRLLAASEIGLRRIAERLPESAREGAKRRARGFLGRLPLARRQ